MGHLIPMQIGVEGFYTLRIIRPDGSCRKELTFKNLITDAGMNQIASGGSGSFGIPFLFTKCKVGTGTTPPAFTDTDLVTPIATVGPIESSTNSFVEEAGATPAYWRSVKAFRFGTGVAAGNLSEVGLFDAGTNQAFSRALITDGGGTPITITVLSDEILDVTYEYRSYIDKTSYNFNVTIAGVVYTLTLMPQNINSSPLIDRAIRSTSGASLSTSSAYESNVLGTVYQGIPAGGSFGQSGTPAEAAYAAGTFYKDLTYTWGLSVANFATGIGGILFDMQQTKVKIGFTPKIPKTNIKTFAITLRIAWARYP